MTDIGENARSAKSDKANMTVDAGRIDRSELRMMQSRPLRGDVGRVRSRWSAAQ